MKSFSHIHRRLFSWYKTHKRRLPWRETQNPYHILVSELMLQQTQVDRVLLKYPEFLKRFPTLQSLSKARVADVIRAWAGLGYNRRALYLQKTAQVIVTEFDGKFPRNLELLKSLPGIGDYTARAILSFAFEENVPMMDTNHRRFYNRVLFGHKKMKDSVLLKSAESLLPPRRAYDWNQALMDFGSALCTTRLPACSVCPLKTVCLYVQTDGSTKEILQRLKKKQSKKIPFRQTDRFVRGRIIDRLRTEASVSRKNLSKFLPDFEQGRVDRIIEDLVADGLVKVRRHLISLPD